MSDLDFQVLKLIYRSSPESITVRNIADILNIPHSTTGSCVKRLESERYLTYERKGPVTLTEKGQDMAIELLRHSQLLEVLLHKSLGLPIAEAHKESEKVNFLFSCETINKICEKFGHPHETPCGEEILNSSSCHCEKHH